MPAARYWRVVGLDTYGQGDLSICALHLYAAGARVDAVASLSAAIPPVEGSVSDLQSAALTATVTWPRAAAAAAGFAITWGFGSAVNVDAIRIGARGKAKFPAFITLQSSDNATDWTTFSTARGVSWPGGGALSELPSALPSASPFDVVSMDFEGSDDSTTMVDAAGHSFVAYGGAKLTTTNPMGGASSLLLNGSTSYIQTPSHPDFDFGTGAFTLLFSIRPASLAADQTLISRSSSGSYRPTEWALLINSASELRWYRGLRGSWLAQARFTLAQPMVIGGEYRVIFGRDAFGRRRCFVNGSACAITYLENDGEIETTDLSNPGADLPLTVGAFADFSGLNYAGQLDSLRVRKGESPPLTEADLRSLTMLDPTPPLRAGTTSLRVAASSPISTCSVPAAFQPLMTRDVEHGGPGTIYGTTKTKGTPNTPIKARVVLLHQRSKLPVRETWSDPVTGYFEFRGIDTNQQFLTLAEDAAGNFRPVAANRLTPEVLA